jgi:hypothetical protein
MVVCVRELERFGADVELHAQGHSGKGANCMHRVIQERAQISFIPWQAEEFNFEVGHPRCAFSLLVTYEMVDTTKF